MALAKIASLWIGPKLSWLEQLCLKSFADAGHSTTLFVYDEVKGVPDGIEIADANDYLPANDFVRHARTGSPAYHADVFRLRMIRDSNFTWVDTDAYCNAPITIPRHGHLHGWISDNKPLVNNGVLKLPKKSKTLKEMLDFTSDEYPIPPWFSEEKQQDLRERKEAGNGEHVSLLPWGVWGPNLLTHFLQETGEIKHSLPGAALYPVPFANKRALLNPRRRPIVESWVTDETLSIHFWGRRFRAAASDNGGTPPEGSYTAQLLNKHDIDPAPTAHLMQPVAPIVDSIAKSKTPTTTDISTIDFSMFTQEDVMNLCMQRSSAVKSRKAINEWISGDDSLLAEEAKNNRDDILGSAFAEIEGVFNDFSQSVADLSPKKIADIGCGYAFVDLLVYRMLGCELILIDVEETEGRHFGFENTAAGYSNLDKAKQFLVANGVPEEKITILNPRTQELASIGKVDMAMSLLSCGFHFPAQTYDAFFEEQVEANGGILLDIRKGSGGIPYMKKFGETKVLKLQKKYSSVMTLKKAA
jgi:hypothetical protein